jgi:hypothetical protein
LSHARAVRLNDFYADPKRASSEELDFGSSWRTRGDDPWKVVWLQATGELAAFQESAYQGWQPSGVGGGGGGGGNFVADMAFSFVFDAALEGVVGLFRHGAPKPHPELDEVVVIGVEPDLLRLRGALLGWEDHLPEPNGLAWLAERVDELSPGHQG